MPHWGGASATHGSVNVTATTGTVLAASTTAHYRRFQNVGTAVVYLNFGAAAVVNTGVPLYGPGTPDSILEMSEARGNVYRGVVQGIIATGGTSKVLTTEW